MVAAARLPDLGAAFDPDVTYLIQLVTVLTKPDYWPEEMVRDASRELMQRYRRIPTLDDLAATFGRDPVLSVASDMIATRAAELADAAERMGIGSQCHLCGGPPSTHYDFALGTIVKKHWGSAIGMLALNVLTVPLAGVAVGPRGVGSTARLARCRLILCSSCADARRGFFGGLKMTQAECSRHPSWNRLVRAGYDRFFNAELLAQYR